MEGGAFAKTVFGNEPTKPDYRFVSIAFEGQFEEGALKFMTVYYGLIMIIKTENISCR